MKNTRRNKIMNASILLVILASGTSLFVSVQTPAPTLVAVYFVRELEIVQSSAFMREKMHKDWTPDLKLADYVSAETVHA